MQNHRSWQGVRMRRIAAGEPDGPIRAVTLPAAWSHAAAQGLVQLVPGQGPVSVATAAEGWIAAARSAGLTPPVAARLHDLLRDRRGAPTGPWSTLRPTLQVARSGDPPRFVLNLAAFHHPEHGLDHAALVEAAADGVALLRAWSVQAPVIAIADLDGLLAREGLEYSQAEARALAIDIARMLRGVADAAGGKIAAAPPGPVEAVLGVETGGIAPAFSPLDESGALTRTASALLAARGITPEAALAATLAGRSPFPTVSAADRAAMRRAMTPYLHEIHDAAAPRLEPAVPPRRRDLPARHGGVTQKAVVGGHRVYLRTGEYADGTLAEIAIGLPKESAALRGAMDCVAAAVSLGLQHGVPLAEFVEAFAGTSFGPGGAVEDDPAVDRASSIADYVARTLAATYLGRSLPAPAETDAPAPLPLDLPAPEPSGDPRSRRRALRLVAR